MKIPFILNDESVTAEVPADKRLVDILREDFGLTETHAGCYEGRCGSCLVFYNDRVVPSCLIPAFEARGSRVVTAEGFAVTEDYRDILRAFNDANYRPCRFCRNPRIMLIAGLLEQSLSPTPQEIRTCMSAVPCECSDFTRLITAVRRSAMYIGRRHRARRS